MTQPVNYYWPPSQNTGKSVTIRSFVDGIVIARSYTPTAYTLIGGASGLIMEEVDIVSGTTVGFASSCGDGADGVWLLGYFGDVSYLPADDAQQAFPIPNAVSGDIFSGAAFCQGYPYFAAANGGLLTVSGGAVTTVNPAFGQSVCSLSSDGTYLYGVMPDSSNLATYTLDTPTTGSVATTAVPMTVPALVCASVSGVGVAGWSNSTIVSGASSFSMNPGANYVVATSPAANSVLLLAGPEPDWSISQAVSGTGSPIYAEWVSSGEQVLIADEANGTVQVFNMAAGTLSLAQTLAVSGATAIAVAATGDTAFVIQPSQNQISVLANTLNVWYVSQTITALTAPASALALSATEIIVGSSGELAWLAYGAGSWSVKTAVSGLGFTPAGLAIDSSNNVYAAGGSGTGHLAVITTDGIQTSTTWDGSSNAVYFEQAQIAVADATNSLIRVFSYYNTLSQQATAPAPAGCAFIGYTYPSVWLCGASGMWQDFFTAPFTLSPQRTGVVSVYHGGEWHTVQLDVGHQPSAAAWDVSGSLWIATLQNDLITMSANGVVGTDQVLESDDNVTLGISAMTWWSNALWAASSMNESLMLVSGTAPASSSTIVAPSAPVALVASSILPTSVGLSWLAPFTGTQPIAYQVQYQVLGSGHWIDSGPSKLSTSATVAGLTQNTTYMFQVIASNYAGSATSITLSAVTPIGLSPTAPAGLTTGSVTSTSVALTWQAPAAGTAPIEYQVQYQTIGGLWTPFGSEQTALSAVVTGLSVNTQYNFQVVASNSYGTATSATATAATLGVAPTAPTALTTGTVTSTSVALSWTASTTGTAPIEYQVQYQAAGATTWTSFGSAQTSTTATVTGLSTATDYNFQVVASNAEGSATSASVSATTGSIAPSAPTGLTVGSITTTSVVLNWTASAAGTQPINYQAQYETAVDGTWAPFGSPQTGTSVEISGLDIDTLYNFQIIASNSVGSATSATATAATSGVAPTAPTGLATSSVTSTSLTLSWDAPATGTPAPDYQVQYMETNGGTWTNYGGAQSALSVAIAGLYADTEYSFQVTATNTYGSATSSTVTADTLGIAPSAPGTPVATGETSSTVSLSWTASAIGTSPIEYQVQYRPHGSGSWSDFRSASTSLTSTVSGLTDATSYDFEITASNTWGTATSGILTASTSSQIAGTTWDPADLANVSLSNSDYTATVSGVVQAGVRSTTALSNASVYAEFTTTSIGEYELVGLATSAWSETASGGLGGDTNSIGIASNGDVYFNGSVIGTASPWVAGGTLGVAANLNTHKVWFTTNGTTWDAPGSGDNPATGTGGFNVSGIVSDSALYAAFGALAIGHVSGSANTGTSDPIISGPASATVVVGQTIAVAGITLSDSIWPFSGDCALNLSVNLGTIAAYVSGTAVSGSGTNYISYSDITENTQEATASLTYTAPSSIGSDSLTVNLYDQEGNSNTLTIPISIVASDPCVKTANFGGSSFDYSIPAGYQAWSAVSGVAPSAPTGVTVSDLTSTGATLEWNASTGTAPITYQAQYGTVSGSWTTYGEPQSSLNLTVAGLESDTGYLFRIVASNPYGSTDSTSVSGTTLGASATTWNPYDLTNMTLSNSNRTATTNTTTQAGVRSTSYRSSGLLYAEVTLTTANAAETIGIANAQWPEGVANGVGAGVNSIGLRSTGGVFIDNTQIGSAMPAWTAGTVVGLAFNFNTEKLFITYNGTTWDAEGSNDNPATGEGGYSFSTMAAGPYYIAFGALATAGASGVSGSQNSGTSQPVVTGPTTVTVTAGATVSVTGITLADSNQPLSGSCVLNIYSNSGNLTVTPATSGSATGNDTTSVSVSDTFPNCQSAIASLTYAAGPSTGSDTITVQLWDQMGLNNEIEITVTINPTANAIKILNAGEQAFAYPVPSGYEAWDSYPPAVVTNLVGTAATTSVALNWTAPAIGTAPITYQVQYRVHGGSTWTNFVSGLSATHDVVTGLNSSTEYDFQIIPVNSLGNNITPFITVTTLSTGAALPGDVSGTVADRVADMMEIFGTNCFPNGQDGSNAGGTNAASDYVTGLNFICGGSGMGMFNRIYANSTTLDIPFITAVCEGVPYTKFTSCINYDSSSEAVVEAEAQDTALVSNGYLVAVEGYNEPNNSQVQSSGAVVPVATCLSAQESLYSIAYPLGLQVMAPSVIDTGSNTYLTDYYGSDLANFNANSTWCNGHDYPNSGAPNNDMARRSDYLSQTTGLPAAITEFHPLLDNNQGNNTAAACYYTAIALLSGYVDHHLEALIWFCFYDYSGYGIPVGLFQGFDPNTPSTSAITLSAMYQLTTDPGGELRHNFTPSMLNYTASNLPAAATFSSLSGGRTALFQNSAGTFFLYVWNEQNAVGGTTVPVTITFNETAMTKITEYIVTDSSSASAPTTPVQTVTDASSITIQLAAEVHLLVINY